MRHSCVRLFFFFVVSAILNVSGVAGAGFPNKAVSLPHNQGNILQFRSGGHVLGFTPTKVYMVGLGYALIEEFVGTSGVMPVAAPSKDTGQAHGPQRWEKGAPSFHGVSYAGLWEGITVRYDRVSEGLAESVYVIDPGANPEKIRVRYNMDFEIQEDGQLRLRHTTKKGYFTLSRPRAWQEIGGRKVSVDIAFKKYGDRTLGFVLESWDPGHPLMIDPTYQWHTLYGSGSDDVGHNIAVTGDGVYVIGYSWATWDVGGTGPLHAHSGFYDIVVLKLDINGAYQWHTFYGSGDIDYGYGIAVTGDGVYVTGESRATWDVNGTGPKHAYSGSIDIFALKLDLNGNYQWHTFYGSGSNDVGFRIAVTGDGVYVIGYSFATWNVDSTGPLHAYSGMYDIVVLKLNTGGTYQWHTFYGSGDNDSSSGIAVTGDGVYATGYSYGTWDVDGTGPLHAYSGSLDIFVLKLNTNGTYLWHTFYGSAGEDRGRGIAVTGDGVYVTGYSNATWDVDGTGPLHAYSGSLDIFALKLDPNGNYQWHTFYGSGGSDYGRGISVTGDGVYVTGYSYGTWDVDGTGPLHAYSGSNDIVVLKLDINGTYRWHTFYGSGSSDAGHGIAVTGDGVYVTGYSEASWDVDGAEPLHAYSGASDIVVLKLTDPKPPTPVPTLGEWGMGIMILLLGLTSFVVLRRRGISMRN